MEGFWAYSQKHAKKRDHAAGTPPPAINIDSDEEDEESDGSDKSTASVSTVMSSLIQDFRMEREFWVGQEASSLCDLPGDAMVSCFYFLSEKELMRCLVTCAGWRSLLVQETPGNGFFWRNEVRRLMQSARVWSVHHNLYKLYFRNKGTLPDVADSVVLCKIRAKKIYELNKRKRFYAKLAQQDETIQLIQRDDTATDDGTIANTPAHLYFVKAFIKASRVYRGMGVPLLAFLYFQGGVITVALSIGTPPLWWPLFVPSFLLTSIFITASWIDVCVMLCSMCCVSAVKYNKALPSSRWLTISEHPTVNRVLIWFLGGFWSAFLIMVEYKIDGKATHPGWVVVFAPLLAMLGVVIIVLAVDLYRQRIIYFWLDDGYDFVESDRRLEAEQQLDETWHHLISPKLYSALSFAAFITLISMKIDSVVDIPFSVIFVPLYFVLYTARRLTTRFNKVHRYVTWGIICHLVFFVLLGVNLDISEYIHGTPTRDNLVIPMSVVSIPFWAILLGPLLERCGLI